MKELDEIPVLSVDCEWGFLEKFDGILATIKHAPESAAIKESARDLVKARVNKHKVS